MNLTELCSLFDRYEIVDTQAQIDREYYATLEDIYTDGDYKTNVTRDAYIHITSVQNASYLIFVDLESKIYLCIYKYVPETKYKLIKQKLRFLKTVLKEMNINNDYKDDKIEIIKECIDDDVIDINIFTCTECNCEDKLIFYRSKTNPEALCTTCNNCKTEYTFVPSKYYKLSSKRVIYYKSEKSSRLVEIEDSVIDNTIAKQQHSSTTSQYLNNCKPK